MATAIVPSSSLKVFTILGLNLSMTITRHQRYSNPNAQDIISSPWRIVIGIFMAIGVVVGVFGNMLVLFALLLDRKLRKFDGNLVILNLAVTDLLMVSLPMPVFGVYFVFYWPQWTLGKPLCKATVYSASVSSSVTCLTMMFIALQRYFAIVRSKPMLNSRNVKIVLCLSWVLSAINSILPVLLNDNIIYDINFKNGNYKVCYGFGTQALPINLGGGVLLSMGLTISAFIFIAFVLSIYARIGVFLWRARNSPIHQKMQKRGADRKVQALKLMFAILLTNIICFLPFGVAMCLRFLATSPENRHIDSRLWLIAVSLAMSNSSINPVLYALVSQKFRAAYQSIWRRARGRMFSFFHNDTDAGQNNP